MKNTTFVWEPNMTVRENIHSFFILHPLQCERVILSYNNFINLQNEIGAKTVYYRHDSLPPCIGLVAPTGHSLVYFSPQISDTEIFYLSNYRR